MRPEDLALWGRVSPDHTGDVLERPIDALSTGIAELSVSLAGVTLRLDH